MFKENFRERVRRRHGVAKINTDPSTGSG